MTEIPPALVQALQDRYRVERHLGQGGMATVYLAGDLKHHRKVAIKVLREITIAAGLDRALPREPDGTIALTARAWAVRGTAA